MIDYLGTRVSRPPTNGSRARIWLACLSAVLIVLFGGMSVLAGLGSSPRMDQIVVLTPNEETADSAEQLNARLTRARRQLARLRPRGVYIVVDIFHNKLHVYRNDELLRSVVCSTGTGIVLRDPRSGREWVFDTPLGERTIQRKVRNPVWAKPDWAFIEDGYLPPEDPNERFDPYSLGRFGLYMGDGYIIHGTLFESLLGQRVTHGCIRLGDQDLEYVYYNAPLGTKVYLY